MNNILEAVHLLLAITVFTMTLICMFAFLDLQRDIHKLVFQKEKEIIVLNGQTDRLVAAIDRISDKIRLLQ